MYKGILKLGVAFVGFLLLPLGSAVHASSSTIAHLQSNTANELRSTITNGSRSYTLQLRDSSLQGGRLIDQPRDAIPPQGAEGKSYAIPIARSPSIIQKIEYNVAYEGKKVGVCYFSIQNHINNKPIEYDVTCEMKDSAPYPVTTMKRAKTADKVDTVEFLVTN